MSGQTLDLARKGVDDELYVLGGYPFNSFLDHVIAILILDAFQHVVLKLFDQLRLLVCKDVFKSLDMSAKAQHNKCKQTHLLHNSATVHLSR
jgi:hypothetical protein